MAIDLKKNNDSITKALEKVYDDNDNTDWVLFGYEGQTSVLKVVANGDEGIEEMADDLSSGKMMYGYARVTDPNSGLPKYVLIHWTGESVPDNLKLKFTSHTRDIQILLKKIHVTIPARCEEDVDVDDIIQKVAKSSGANYGFHKEKARPDQGISQPVGTDYKRIIPTKEINLDKRDEFWAKTEKEEVSRQKEQRDMAEEQRKKADEERKEREMKETKERDRQITERMKGIGQQRTYERRASQEDKTIEKQKWQQVQRESSIDEEERGHRSDKMRQERAAEAAKLVSSSTSSARNFFKQKSVERPESQPQRGPPPVRKLQHSFGQSSSQQEPAPPKQPIQLPKQEEVPPSKPCRQPDPEEEPEPEPEPQRMAAPVSEPEPVEQIPTSPVTSPVTQDLLRQSLPQRQQDSDAEEEEDQEWEEQTAEDFMFREKRVPSITEDYSAEQDHAEAESQRMSGQEYYAEDTTPEAVHAEQPEITPEMQLCARAIYDYQAADDTEITFDPNDLITNIEQIDEGWWQGFAPDGKYGMFPANYVELIN